VFITSNASRLSGRIPEGALSHTIELLFSKDWLYTHLAGMEEKIMSIIDELGQERLASVITGATQPADDRLLSEIEFELHKPLLNLLAVRSRALMVMANVINRIPGRNTLPLPPREAPYIQTIRQVEQRLIESLENTLPSQKQLAKEFAISESTLRRRFKAVYGKTMYEYYLEKKQELAKWLLQGKKDQ
jgi:hypothetical protein